MTEMLAARAHQGSAMLQLDKIPAPEPGPLDVVVRVAAAGIAPGMMTLLARGAFRHLPTTLGHEAAGTVHAVGADVGDWSVGDRVRVHPNLTCRSCRYCRSDREPMCAQFAMMGHAAIGSGPMPLYERYHDGGLAEFVRVPHWLLDRLPDGVGFDAAAKVHDVANAVRALKYAVAPFASTLVVTAATGTMGVATVALAPLYGVSRLVLVARSADRLESVAASSHVPVETVALEHLPDDWADTGGLTRALREIAPAGVDAVIDYVPDGPATAQATAALATGATMVHMGANASPLPFPAIAVMVNCWRIVGSRGCSRDDALQVLDLLGSGALDIDPLISHRFPLTEAAAAVTAMQSRQEPMWMTVLHP